MSYICVLSLRSASLALYIPVWTLCYNDFDIFWENEESGLIYEYKIIFNNTFVNYVFCFLEPFRARLASKIAKSANVTPNIFFLTRINMGINKFRIWCWFYSKSVEKIAKGRLRTVLKDEEQHNSYSFMLITFCINFFAAFSTIGSIHGQAVKIVTRIVCPLSTLLLGCGTLCPGRHTYG